MELGKFINVPEVAIFVRRYAPGQSLFQQGQMAKSAFFILEGMVELVAAGSEADFREALLGPGQFLGEKALLSAAPYLRRFGAVAKEPTRALELGAADLERLQRAAPQLVVELLRSVLRVTAERLDRMNFLVNALSSMEMADRFIALVHYYSRTLGRAEEGGIEVELNPDALARYLGSDPAVVMKWLDRLVQNGVIQRRKEQKYLIPNQAELEEFVRRFKAAA
jgi:CRP-like cAMP-binding protein